MMQVAAFEGVIEGGQIRLKTDVHLPEKAKIYVIIPDFKAKRIVHVFSPRLAHTEQATDLERSHRGTT
jgi:hypothetical protein